MTDRLPVDPLIEALNQARILQRISQKDLAGRAGTYQGHHSRIFTGRQIPRLDVVRSMADALDVRLAVLGPCWCGQPTCHNWREVR